MLLSLKTTDNEKFIVNTDAIEAIVWDEDDKCYTIDTTHYSFPITIEDYNKLAGNDIIDYRGI